MEHKNKLYICQDTYLTKFVKIKSAVNLLMSTFVFFAFNFLPSTITFVSGLTVFTSTQSGNWNATSTWNETGSGNPIKYIISASHTVTITSDADDIDTLRIYGVLKFNNSNDMELDDNNGVLEVMSTGTITNGNSSSEIEFDGVYSIYGPFNESGPKYATSSSSGFISGPLPVSWLAFYAAVSKGSVKLVWQTASEENNSHFIIEKAQSDGVFSNIGRVEGNGNSQQILTYIFDDNEIFINAAFYRLKQVDFDGKYQYSKTIFVGIHNERIDAKVLFPTIIERGDFRFLNITNVPVGIYKIQVIDVEGKIISMFDHKQFEMGNFDLSFMNTTCFAKGLHHLFIHGEYLTDIFKIIVK